MIDWWQDFFDADYLRLWAQTEATGSLAAQVEGLWSLLGLHEGSRVLDAPCGYGRLSRPLAERGAVVLGVDQSQTLLDHAERERRGPVDVNARSSSCLLRLECWGLAGDRRGRLNGFEL